VSVLQKVYSHTSHWKVTDNLTQTEKKLHSDIALAYLYENSDRQPMTLEEIANFTGMPLNRLNDIYASALNKLRKSAKLIQEDLI